MKEEIKRINKLVADGKLSPEDAADLIDAFYNSEESNTTSEPKASASATTEEPKHTEATQSESKPRDPFRSIIDAVERLGKEVTENIDWKDVTDNARTNAKKGLDVLKTGLEDVTKGKFNLGWLFSSSTREVQLPLTILDGQTLRIDNVCGDITVLPSQTSSYVIAKAKFRGATQEDAQAKADRYTLIAEASDHSVDIKQVHESGLEVDIEVYVAATPAVEIKSGAGDVTVTNTKNACRVRSSAGSVTISGMSGPIDVNADSGNVSIANSESGNLVIENKSGDISVDNVTSNMNLRSVSGDISVRGSHGKTLAFEAVSGDVSLDIPQPILGSLSVRTVSGDARISVTDGSDARVAITTLRGVAQIDLDLQERAQSDQRITGRVGDGNGTIDISAVTGNVSLGLRAQ